jgi:ArsR family transcriptional regulator
MSLSMTALLDALRAAAEPTRLRLLALCAQGELTVSELVQILGQSQPRVSRHLKLLCDAGLLDRLPEGSWVFYRLAAGTHADGSAGALARKLAELLPTDDAQLQRDRDGLNARRGPRARPPISTPMRQVGTASARCMRTTAKSSSACSI